MEEISHYLQDHFQHSAEANFHRKFENVLLTRLTEKQRDIETADYRIGEKELLAKARNEPELTIAENIVKKQREINALNFKFKATKHARDGLGLVTLEYLKEDAEVVKSLIAGASDPAFCSDAEFKRLMKTNAASLLAVQASPAEESVALFKSFRDAYGLRTGTEITDDQLLASYEAARSEMKEWLKRHADPFRAPSAERVISTGLSPDQQLNGKRFDYLDNNLAIVKQRLPLEKSLALSKSRLSTLQGLDAGHLIDGYKHTKKKLAAELDQAKARQKDRIAAYRQYKTDVEHFENNRGDLMALHGEAADHVLSHTQDIPHQIGRFFSKNLGDAFRRGAKGQYVSSVGALVGFELSKGAFSKPEVPPLPVPIDKAPVDARPVAVEPFRTRFVRADASAEPLPFHSSDESYRAQIEKTTGELKKVREAYAKKNAQIEKIKAFYQDKLADYGFSHFMVKGGNPVIRKEIGRIKAAWDKALRELDVLNEKIASLKMSIAQQQAQHSEVLTYKRMRNDLRDEIGRFGTEPRKTTSAYFQSLLALVKHFDDEHQLELLVRLVGKTLKLEEAERLELVASVWSAVESLDQPMQANFVDDIFLTLSGGEKLTLVGQLIDIVEKMDPKLRGKRLEWLGYALEKLDEEDRHAAASRILEMVKALPGADRHYSLFQLGIQIRTLSSSDRSAMFDSIYNEAKALPVEFKAAHLIGLVHRIGDPKTSNTGFSSFVPRKQSDGTIELNSLTLAICKATPGNRKALFDEMLKCIGKMRFAENKHDPLLTLAAEISALSEAEQQAAFDAFGLEADNMTPTDRTVLWAKCIGVLPERFCVAALARANSAIQDVAQADQPALLLILDKLIPKKYSNGFRAPRELETGTSAIDIPVEPSTLGSGGNKGPVLRPSTFAELDMHSRYREEIANELPFANCETPKHIVYEVLSSDGKGKSLTWHIAQSLDEVKEKAKSGPDKIRFVVEVNQTSNVHRQFEVMNVYKFETKKPPTKV